MLTLRGFRLTGRNHKTRDVDDTIWLPFDDWTIEGVAGLVVTQKTAKLLGQALLNYGNTGNFKGEKQ